MKTIPPITVCWADTVPYFPETFTHGRVIQVNTGHTMTLAAFPGNQGESQIPYRLSVRLRGVDGPRICSRSEGERRIATKARLAVEGMILGSVVELRAAFFDRRGRISATVYTHTGLDLSDWLVGQRLAVYRAGSVHPTCWLLYYETGNKPERYGNKHRCVFDVTSKFRTDCFFFNLSGHRTAPH